MRRRGLAAGAVGLLLLSGCATVQPDARFAAVQQATQDRLGHQLIWDRGGPEAEAIRTTIDRLLSRGLAAEDAVQVALLNSQGLQGIFEELGIAQADLVQAGLVRNPDLAGFVRFPDRAPWGVNWNVGFDFWPLDVFLVPLRKRLAGTALDAAESRVSQAVLDLAARTRTAYYALGADQQVLAAQRSVADLAGIASDLAGRQYQAGNIDDLRLATERARHQQASLALIEAENAVRLGRERLRRIMGLAASDRSWTIAAAKAVPVGDAPDAEPLVMRALQQRPELAGAKSNVERLEYALALTRKWWLAPVRVGVETERASGGGFQTGPHFSLEIPVFDQRQAARSRQEALIRQARRRLADLEEEVRTEVRSALDRMRTAQRVARYYEEEVIPLRARVVEMSEQRYQSMIFGVFEMLTAKSDEATAVIAGARATREYWAALADLELAVGTRLFPGGVTR
jgi:cobalt-zinc-cadmium efflux system outer membrane protein